MIACKSVRNGLNQPVYIVPGKEKSGFYFSLSQNPSNRITNETDELKPTGTKKMRSEVKNYRDDNSMVKQVVYMLVTVVVLFAICWTPILIDNILTAYNVLSQERAGFLKYMLSTFHLLSYFNR